MANIDQVQLPDGSQYHIIDDTSGYATTTYVQDQISTINKNTIGLGNVDNTADINKPVSLPQQAALNGKVDDDIVAYVESDTTATKRYEVGDQFILNGVLYTATAIIAVNDTIVIGTNASLADSITTQIGTKANKADLTNLDLTGTTNTTGSTIAAGTYFYLNGVLVRAKTDIASGATFTLNTNYEVVTAGGLNGLSEQIKSKIPMIEETTITMSVAAGYTEHATYSFPEKSGYSRAMTVVQNLSGSGSATCSIHLNGAPWTGDVYVYSPSVAASLTITLRCLYLPSI